MEITEKNGVLFFEIFTSKVRVNINEIICITLSEFKRNIDITIEKGFKSIPMSMEEIESKLKNFDFVKTKESVLINRAKIQEIDVERKKVILNNGFEIDVTRRDIRKIKRKKKEKRWWWF